MRAKKAISKANGSDRGVAEKITARVEIMTGLVLLWTGQTGNQGGSKWMEPRLFISFLADCIEDCHAKLIGLCLVIESFGRKNLATPSCSYSRKTGAHDHANSKHRKCCSLQLLFVILLSVLGGHMV